MPKQKNRPTRGKREERGRREQGGPKTGQYTDARDCSGPPRREQAGPKATNSRNNLKQKKTWNHGSLKLLGFERVFGTLMDPGNHPLPDTKDHALHSSSTRSLQPLLRFENNPFLLILLPLSAVPSFGNLKSSRGPIIDQSLPFYPPAPLLMTTSIRKEGVRSVYHEGRKHKRRSTKK